MKPVNPEKLRGKFFEALNRGAFNTTCLVCGATVNQSSDAWKIHIKWHVRSQNNA